MVRPGRDRIGGQPRDHVEIDEFWVGGRTRGEGRGVHNQSLVIAAVEVRQRKPGTSQACRAATADMPAGFDGGCAGSVGKIAVRVCRGGGRTGLVVTDAWGGYATLSDRGYRHLPVAAQGDPSVAEDFLPISHLIFSI